MRANQSFQFANLASHPGTTNFRGSIGRKANPKRHLETDKKLAKIRKLRAHLVETHFIHDRLDLRRCLRKERDRPLHIVETRGPGNELENPSRVSSSHARMTRHKLLAGREIQRIPVLADTPAF